jgi:hypothetical protein
MSALAVARRFYASFFNVGDIILYGKYKNKKGRILSFGQDAKGNPTVTLEPVPKGRKQNKTMTLFKIWKMPKTEDQKEAAMSMSRRVVARFIQARGVEVGRTINVGDIRIHRYSDSFLVTDLTNAGKRGKKVKLLSIGLGGGSEVRDRGSWLDELSSGLAHQTTYAGVVGYLNHIKQDEPYLFWDIREERGIDVEPSGNKITMKTNTGLVIESSATEFRVLNRQSLSHPKTGEPMNAVQDTNYFNVSKESANVFFAWLQKNLSVANNLDMNGLRNIWDGLGVKYDYR